MVINKHNCLVKLCVLSIIFAILFVNIYPSNLRVNGLNNPAKGNFDDKTYINFENASSYKAITYSPEYGFDSGVNHDKNIVGSSLMIEVKKPGTFIIPFLNDDSSLVKLEKGKTYVLEFYCKALMSNSQPIKIDFYASSANDINVRTQLTGWNADPALNTQIQIVETTDSWTKKIVKFTVENELSSDANNLTMGIYAEQSQKFNYQFNIDNITVTCVEKDESIVTLNIPDGHQKTEVLHGVYNISELTQQMLDSRAIQKEGYAFDGWYTDVGCTQKYSVTGYFPKNDTNLYAKWIDVRDVKSYTVDFENYDTSVGGVMSVNAGFSGIYDGIKSLTASMPKVGFGQNVFRTLKTTEGDRVELKNNTTYVITYFINVKKAANSNSIYSKIDFYRTSTSTVSEHMDWNNVELVTDWQKGTQKTIISETNDWQQVSCVFTTNFTNKVECKYLAIGVYDSEGFGVDISFDNFVITEANESQRPLIINSNDENNNLRVEFGSVGQKYNIPAPAKRDGYVFVGWYDEPTFQNKITQIVFTTESKEIYAKWAVVSNGSTADLSFEKGYDNSANRGGSNVARTGNNSIYFKADGTEKTPLSQFAVILDNNANPYKLKDGASYVVSYWVKAKDINEKYPFKFDFYRTDGNMSNEDRVQMTFWNQEISKNTQIEIRSGDWMQVLTYFTVNLSSDTMHRNSEYLGIGCYLGDSAKDVYGETYIDDMTIIELPTLNRAFILNVNDDKNTIKVVYGKSGEKANLPTYGKNNGMNFSGWTYDYEQKKDFTEYVYPEDTTRLYGKWLLDYSKPDYFITFEDYLEYNDFSDNVKASEAVSLSTEQPYNGKYSLKLESEGSYIPGQAFLYNGKETLALEPGATYVVNYNFYVPESDYVDIVDIHFLTSSPINRGNSWVRQTFWEGELELGEGEKQIGHSFSIRWDTETDVWHNHTSILKADCTDTNNALSVIAWGGKGSRTVYIDDISITKIDNGNSYIHFDSNYTGGDDLTVQGKAGQSCATPDLVRENYQFGGWYTSNKFEPDTEYNEFNVIPDKPVYLYAKWERIKYIQNFENFDAVMTGVDRDYELINSKDNNLVFEGNFSMHRIGVSKREKAFSIMTSLHDKLSMNEYIISMRVKVKSFAEENDFLKIVNTKSPYNQWSYDIGTMDVIKLSAIADGEWQHIAFRCKNIDPFFALVTPGNSDVYFDDIQIYMKGYEPEFDKNTIIINNTNESFMKNETSSDPAESENNNLMMILIIGVSSILVIAIVVVVVICYKKRFFSKMLKRRQK